MSRAWGRAVLILLLASTLVAAAAVAAVWTMWPLDGTAITIDGERFSLGDLGGGHAVAVLVAIVAAVAVAVLVAIAVGAFGLGLGVLGLAFGGLITVATIAFVAAPFVLVAWLVWRLVRGRPAPLPVRT